MGQVVITIYSLVEIERTLHANAFTSCGRPYTKTPLRQASCRELLVRSHCPYAHLNTQAQYTPSRFRLSTNTYPCQSTPSPIWPSFRLTAHFRKRSWRSCDRNVSRALPSGNSTCSPSSLNAPSTRNSIFCGSWKIIYRRSTSTRR
jgi:hypothetical protein